MSTLARAWDAFMKAIHEARAWTVTGAQPDAIVDLTRYAREMLGILESDIANHRSMTVSGAHEVLAQLRNRLTVLEREVIERQVTQANLAPTPSDPPKTKGIGQPTLLQRSR